MSSPVTRPLLFCAAPAGPRRRDYQKGLVTRLIVRVYKYIIYNASLIITFLVWTQIDANNLISNKGSHRLPTHTLCMSTSVWLNEKDTNRILSLNLTFFVCRKTDRWPLRRHPQVFHCRSIKYATLLPCAWAHQIWVGHGRCQSHSQSRSSRRKSIANH